MRMISTAAVAAALLAMPAPGFATIDSLGTNPALDQQCDDQLNPSDKSEFTTYAIVIGAPVVNSVTVDNGAGVTVGVGPGVTVLGNYRNAHVNGQSVNIHAYGDRVTTYAGGAITTIPTKTTTTTTTNAGCHVHKPINENAPDQAGNDPLHDRYHMPPGLQLNPVSTTTEVITYGTRTETIQGPWIDPNASAYGIEFVICNSPTKNPGVWRGQNGYVSQIDGKLCSTTWYNSLGSTPSVSVPAS